MKGKKSAVPPAFCLQIWPNWQPQIPAISNMPFLRWRQPVLGVLITSQLTAQSWQNHATNDVPSLAIWSAKQAHSRTERNFQQQGEIKGRDRKPVGYRGRVEARLFPESLRTDRRQNVKNQKGNPLLTTKASRATDCCSPRWAAVRRLNRLMIVKED